jgi:hypothetical protein
MDLVASRATRQSLIEGILIGTLTALDTARGILVDFPGNPAESPTVARSTVALSSTDVSREVALLFEHGDPTRPIVIGLLSQPVAGQPVEMPMRQVELDGERLVFTAEREIVLRCGHATITLTRAGKILIRGAYLLSRSSGVNRIKGGSVQIN